MSYLCQVLLSPIVYREACTENQSYIFLEIYPRLQQTIFVLLSPMHSVIVTQFALSAYLISELPCTYYIASSQNES